MSQVLAGFAFLLAAGVLITVVTHREGPPVDPLRFLAPALAVGAWIAWRALGPVAGLLGLGVAALAVEPWLLARAVAVPLGWPRAAYVLTRLSPWVWRDDRPGGALFAGAWAAARRPVRDERAERWLVFDPDPPEVVVRLTEIRLTGAMLAGHGLIAASRGDRDEARTLLRAAAELFPVPRRVGRVAWGWLAAEAAVRGAWEEVHDAASRAESPEGALLSAIAARLLGLPGAPDRAELEARFRRCPVPSAAYTRALAAPADPGWPPVPAPPRPAALEWHRRALVRPRAVGVAAQAWDAVIGEGDDLWEVVVGDLAAIVDRGGVDPRILGHTRIGQEALRRLRQQALARLEAAMEPIRARTAAPCDQVPLEEVRIWLGVRQLYDRCMRLCVEVTDRREAYAAIYRPMVEHAAGLYRRRHQGHVYRATLRWLRAEAGLLRRKDAMRALDDLLAAPG